MYRNCIQKRTCGCENKIENENNEMCETCQNIENYEDYNSCDCGFNDDSVFPSNYMYAQSYVPWQMLSKTFNPCAGLKMGTIFPELVSPYTPGQSMEEFMYIKNTNNYGEGCN